MCVYEVVQCEWGWWTKSNVWCRSEIWLQLPKIFLSFPRIYPRNQKHSLQVYSERRLTTRNSYRRLSRTRSQKSYVESYFRFPWYLSRSWDVINRKYKPSTGRRYARAENEIQERREIEGSISTNGISMHHVFSPHFIQQNSRKWNMYRKISRLKVSKNRNVIYSIYILNFFV